MKTAAHMLAGNALPRWGTAAAVAVGVWIVLRLVRRVAQSRMKGQFAAGRPGTRVADLLLALLQGTKWYFEMGVALYVGALQLKMPRTLDGQLDQAILLIVLAQLYVWGSRCIAHFAARYQQRHAASGAAITTVAFIALSIRVGFALTLLLLALDNFGINVTTLVAGLGISGVAVALAAQNILGDLFASLSIVFDRPFVVGDFIVVDELCGTVEHVGLKTTRVRSLAGEQIIISNSDLLKSRIRNFKRMRERRTTFVLSVTYQTSYEHLVAIPQILREIIAAQIRCRFGRAHLKAYGPSSLDFEVELYILDPEYLTYMDIQQEIHLAIFKKFGEMGIEFAYPTQTLFVEQGKKDPAGIPPLTPP